MVQMREVLTVGSLSKGFGELPAKGARYEGSAWALQDEEMRQQDNKMMGEQLIEMAGGIQGLAELARENGSSLEAIKDMLAAQGASTAALAKQMAQMAADVAAIKENTAAIDSKVDEMSKGVASVARDVEDIGEGVSRINSGVEEVVDGNKLLMSRFESLRRRMDTQTTGREARLAFFAASHPERWHFAATAGKKAGSIRAKELWTLLRKQHKLGVCLERCQQLLDRFGALATGQHAASMFDLLQHCFEAFDSLEGAADNLVRREVVVAAVPEAVARVAAGAAVALVPERVHAAVPPCEVDFDRFLKVLLVLSADA